MDTLVAVDTAVQGNPYPAPVVEPDPGMVAGRTAEVHTEERTRIPGMRVEVSFSF